MGTVIRNLIQYEGGEECNYTNGAFRQMNVDNIFCLPIVKPDIEQIVKVWVDANICKYELIKTPIGTSLEGQNLTGYKLMIMGEIKVKYEYVALEETQSVHTAHNIVPFCGYIVMPEVFNPKSIVYPMVLVEDIHSEQVSNRCIYTNVTIMLNSDIC